MNLRDQLLRAAVWQAYEERDEQGRITTDAIQRIIDVHRLAPLIECQQSIEAVEQLESDEEAELLAWYASIPTLEPVPFKESRAS